MCLYQRQMGPQHHNIHIKKTLCTPDIELLAVSIRPYYFPREISHVIIIVVYIPPEANTTVSTEIISDWLHKIETSHHDSLRMGLGDFNICTLSSSCPTYKQYISCPTRNGSTLDLCYGNIENAYKSTPLPPLGLPDHNTVLLTPKYRSKLKTSKPTTKTANL